MRTNSKNSINNRAYPAKNAQIEYVPVSSLKGRASNPRTHSPRQIKQIARSIERFGFVNPVLIGRDNKIVCGHGRAAAARLLGIKSVPTIKLEHLNEQELRAYVIADNRLAEKAGWDNDVLAIELQGLSDLGFDIEVTGFEIPEIELIFDTADPPESDPDDDTIPGIISDRVVSRLGDIWTLGDHRLLCGDARRRESFETLLIGEVAQLIFVDPPYNVPISRSRFREGPG